MFFKLTTLLSLLAIAATSTAKAISLPLTSRSSSESAIPTSCPPNQIFHHDACIPSIPCGGLANLPCPAQSQVCVDDPRDDCDPKKNGAGADCGGICVEPTKRCGGMLGLMCPEGWECVDDPRDECVPGKDEGEHGEGCMGVCV